ncbi:Uncharacterized protein dnm_017560 [Desulfonema magnum]|uniref:Uncharacterized protein n=1 Tax=Desulfonema magnum TaxID=45655 RepID=A0A975BHY8_9BACT|nr:Uncharacterized protein dnm_017560 [Desulfonema magnum]
MHSGFLQKTASLNFCTPAFCKKPLRLIFALRLYENFPSAENEQQRGKI